MTVDFDVGTLLAEVLDAIERRPELRERVRALLSAPSGPERLYLTPAQAAQRFGVSRRTVFVWLDRGLPSCGSGRTRRIPSADADRWVRERTQTDDTVERRARVDAARVAARRATA